MDNELYTGMIFFCCFYIIALFIIIYESNRLTINVKKRYYRTGIVVIAAMLSEWGAVALNGAAPETTGLHIALKGLDYVLTPLTGVLFVDQISNKNKIAKPYLVLLGINTVLQIISAFTGNIYFVDENNFYHHGPQYFIYIAIYLLVILMIVVQLYRYGKGFNRHNRLSLIAICLLLFSGIFAQQLINSNLRLTYLTITVCYMLAFIYHSEFLQMNRDAVLDLQKQMLEKDPLTGLKSRYAYTNELNRLHGLQELPKDLVAFSLDLNGLKKVNDEMGHEAGDQLIRSAAEVVSSIFEKYGTCYRTGGDEFVVIAEIQPEDARQIEERIEHEFSARIDLEPGKLSLCVGCALHREEPELTAERLIGLADSRLLQAKSAYYRTAGIDRRR